MNWSFLTGTQVTVAKHGRILEARGRGWPGGLALTVLIGGAFAGIAISYGMIGQGSGVGGSPAPLVWLSALTGTILLAVANFKTFASWNLRIDCGVGNVELVRRWGLLPTRRAASRADERPLFEYVIAPSGHWGPSLHKVVAFFPVQSTWSLLPTVYVTFRRASARLFADVANAMVGTDLPFAWDAVAAVNAHAQASVSREELGRLFAGKDAAEAPKEAAALRADPEFTRKYLAREKIVAAFRSRPGAADIGEALALFETTGVLDPLRELFFDAARQGRPEITGRAEPLLAHDCDGVGRVVMAALVMAAESEASPEAEALRRAAAAGRDPVIRRQAKTALEWLANGRVGE